MMKSQLGDLCKRCKKESTSVVTRKDTFCENCFIRFTRGKQRKQMQDDKFKVRFKETDDRLSLLLDMKNDFESFVLLDSLISMLQEQLTQGPKAVRGFNLTVSIIEDYKDSESHIDISRIEQYYTTEELTRLGIKFVIVDPDTFISTNGIEKLRLDLEHFEITKVQADMIHPQIKTYKDLLAQVVDNSTREDIAAVIREDLIIQTAVENKCSIIVKSHSMTTLAIDILSDTIRGRGAEIPRKSDDIYIGNFEILHPLRDVLNSETRMYTKVMKLDALSPVLQETISISDKSTKNKTVYDMVSEYFMTLEVDYPDVVSTVVKIGAKLANPGPETVKFHCEMCKNPIYHDPKQWLEQITVPRFVPPQNEEEEANLRRYLDAVAKEEKPEVPAGEASLLKLCYGCMVTLGVSNVHDFEWPQRPTREEILAEYIIDTD